MADALRHTLAGARQLRHGNIRVALQKLLCRSFESDEPGRIDAVRQVRANRTDRCLVTNAEAGRVDHVVEVLQIALLRPEGDAPDAAIDIAGVVKQDAADVFSEQGKA